MLKTALHLCRQHQTIHTMLLSWNTYGLVSVGAERIKPKMILLSPSKPTVTCLDFFFFLPFRKLFNQSRPFRVQKLWFSERLKKRGGGGQEREGKRERREKEGGDRGRGKEKRKGWKGERENHAESFQKPHCLWTSGETDSNRKQSVSPTLAA